MAQVKQKYRDIADRMIAAERRNKEAQAAYTRMSRLVYKLPDNLAQWDWVRPVISTAPYDAIRGTVRALSNLEEAISIHPITVYGALKDINSKAAKELANRWETILRWELGRSYERRHDLREDVVWSIAVYDIAVSQLIHVPTQMRLTSALPNRVKAATRFGEWAVRMEDPQSIYVEWSDYGPERVLKISVKSAREIIEFWGNKAAAVSKEVEKGPAREREQRLAEPWCEYDLVGHEDGRTVWVSQGPTPTMDKKGELIFGPAPWLTIKNADGDTGEQVPFLPYIVTAGGTTVDQQREFQQRPILFPIYMAEQWATANIAGTVMMSQQIASASSATDVFTGVGVEDIDEDWTGPRRRLDLNPGQTYQVLQDQGLDAGLREVFDRLEGAIQRATVAEVLVTARPLSGEQAFAAYNLQVQQALAALGGIRGTGQKHMWKIYETMLLLAHYTGNDIKGYGAGLDEYVIKWDEIRPEMIQGKIELKADVPADRVQRVTSASQMSQTMEYPMSRILSMLGETDPEGAMREWELEQMELAYFRAKLEFMQREVSGQYEQDVMAAAQALVQQQLEQMNPTGGGGNGTAPTGGGEAIPGEQGIPGVEGQGFNPAQGGISAAEAAPSEATFESRKGRPRGTNQPIPAIPG